MADLIISQTEENYLKALFHLVSEQEEKQEVSSNKLATYLSVKPATVNDMLRKLKEKKLILNERYGKITLTPLGKRHALKIIRKHRLWETFLYETLEFTWDEVHEVAEQLEHIQSDKLIEKLDRFLRYPQLDPHGDPIPNAKGEMKQVPKLLLSAADTGKFYKMVSIRDDSAAFLQYVMEVGLSLKTKIKIVSRSDFDGMLELEVNGKKIKVSEKFASNIYVVS